MGNEVRKHHPWQDKSGRSLSTLELRLVSKGWSKETWEEYLQTLEAEPDTFLVDCYDKVMEVYPGEPEEDIPATDLIDRPLVEEKVRYLPAQERAVIRALFWDALSERETSELLKISRWAVSALKARALKRLQGEMRNIKSACIKSQNYPKNSFLVRSGERGRVALA